MIFLLDIYNKKMKTTLFFVFFSLCIIRLKTSKANKIIQYAIDRVGCGYIWGGSGQILTEEKLKFFKNKFPSFIKENKSKKWIGKQVFDCSGLVKCAFEQVNIYIYHSAKSAWENTQWEIKGKIENLPIDKVCILYKEGSKGMIHTGIYLGNGEVINAKSDYHGVVKEKLGTLWTHFGIPLGLY